MGAGAGTQASLQSLRLLCLWSRLQSCSPDISLQAGQGREQRDARPQVWAQPQGGQTTGSYPTLISLTNLFGWQHFPDVNNEMVGNHHLAGRRKGGSSPDSTTNYLVTMSFLRRASLVKAH